MASQNQSDNPFVRPIQVPGQGTAVLPAPVWTTGGYAPGLGQMARDYSKEAFGAVRQEMGQRGLLDSSFYPATLERSFRGGFGKALETWQQQQQLFGGIGIEQLRQMAAQPAPGALAGLLGQETFLGGLLTDPLGTRGGKFLGLF